MVYDRNSRGTSPGDQYNYRGEDYGRDYGSGRDYSSSSAREYQAAGAFDRDDDGRGGRDWNRGGDGGRWGQQDAGDAGYAQAFRNRGRGYGGQGGGQQYGQWRGGDHDRAQYGAQGFGQRGFDDDRGGRGG